MHLAKTEFRQIKGKRKVVKCHEKRGKEYLYKKLESNTGLVREGKFTCSTERSGYCNVYYIVK